MSSNSGCAKRYRAVLAGVVLVLAGTAVIARLDAQEMDSIAKAEAPVHGNAENGKRLYQRYGCYECHGGQGQGSVLSGPRIGPNPIGFTGFVRYIRRPSGQMPPYTTKIASDGDLTDVYAFLQALPKPPDVNRLPLLRAQPGMEKKR